MRELVTIEQAERAIGLLAVALPAVGLALGGILGAVRRRPGRGLMIGLLCGAVGPAIWALWRMYNGIIGVYGLDSVKGLLICIALFVAIGLAVGAAMGLLWRRRSGGESEQTSVRLE